MTDRGAFYPIDPLHWAGQHFKAKCQLFRRDMAGQPNELETPLSVDGLRPRQNRLVSNDEFLMVSTANQHDVVLAQDDTFAEGRPENKEVPAFQQLIVQFANQVFSNLNPINDTGMRP